MRSAESGVILHYKFVYRQPYFVRHGAYPAECSKAERYYGEAITLPLHPELSDAQQERVVRALREACA
jgi:dTDP-4-amino-4,6-dideoxygalactose transaminase